MAWFALFGETITPFAIWQMVDAIATASRSEVRLMAERADKDRACYPVVGQLRVRAVYRQEVLMAVRGRKMLTRVPKQT